MAIRLFAAKSAAAASNFKPAQNKMKTNLIGLDIRGFPGCAEVVIDGVSFIPYLLK